MIHALALVVAVDTSSESSDPLTLALASSALIVSLLAAILPAVSGFQQRLRDDRATRGVMFLELMELIERHGLWVVDRTYDLQETHHEDFYTAMPHRRTEMPDRTVRVRARAIVSAYASASVASSYLAWECALEAFEQKLDEFAFIAQESGPQDVDTRETLPLRAAEVSARRTLADVVNRQLVRERRWRRA